MLLQRSAFIVQSSVVRSLRPCWTAFLSILRAVVLLSEMCRPLNFHRATIVFLQTPSHKSNGPPRSWLNLKEVPQKKGEQMEIVGGILGEHTM